MQNRLLLLALIASGVSFSALADIPLQPQHYNQGQRVEDSGIVHFHGSVYASPCVLAPQSRLQVIELGDVSARSFRQMGDRSKPVLVKIYFKDCLKGAAQSRSSLASKTTGNDWRAYTTGEQAVQLTFIGESDPANSQLLRTTGNVLGAGVRILDIKGRALDINQTQPPYVVKTGDSELTFMAALESTGTWVTAGEFRGLLRLKMEYM
ncbi:fimbrial protein [Entomohabitans teleogrylli]|uniref:fimbrial protein n=1 Tax=Entomohabitans teleogrylli TaxID=1384589 RepID=UPI00073D55CA|nr:fimbrial protein [Entomohabitans teleogrylli]